MRSGNFPRTSASMVRRSNSRVMPDGLVNSFESVNLDQEPEQR